MAHTKTTKKEKGAKQPELQDVLDRLENYREALHKSDKIGSMKFMHMQEALHWAKNIVRDCYGAERKGSTAWIK